MRLVVEGETSDESEISIAEARRRGNDDVEVGDVIRKEVFPEDFGRIAAQTARQVIIQRLKDAERQVIYEQFSDKIGNIITGTIFKAEGDQILVRLNEKTEAIIPKEERIIGEKYLPGSRMKFYLLDVRQTTRGPRIIVSGPIQSFFTSCLNSKCRRYRTVWSRSATLSEKRGHAPKSQLRASMRTLNRWAPVWASRGPASSRSATNCTGKGSISSSGPGYPYIYKEFPLSGEGAQNRAPA